MREIASAKDPKALLTRIDQLAKSKDAMHQMVAQAIQDQLVCAAAAHDIGVPLLLEDSTSAFKADEFGKLSSEVFGKLKEVVKKDGSDILKRAEGKLTKETTAFEEALGGFKNAIGDLGKSIDVEKTAAKAASTVVEAPTWMARLFGRSDKYADIARDGMRFEHVSYTKAAVAAAITLGAAYMLFGGKGKQPEAEAAGASR